MGELIAIYILCINAIHLAKRERKPSLSKHSAVASSGAESDQGWAFQKVLPNTSSSSSPLVANLYPPSLNPTALWSDSYFPLFHEHAEAGQKPVSCNLTVCSAPVMQRTPFEKLRNITSETLIYHSDEIMKLVLSGCFYCFFWSTNQ